MDEWNILVCMIRMNFCHFPTLVLVEQIFQLLETNDVIVYDDLLICAH